MHRYEAKGAYQKRREATWVALGGYGHLAPGRVAMDEQRERVMTEAANGRLLASRVPAGERESPRRSVRRRLSDVLMVIGVWLRFVCARRAIAGLRQSSVG